MTVSCSISGCPNPRFGHGWCNKHYKRARRYNGDPLGGGIFRPANGEPETYFWAHVDDVTDDCILWPYAASGGYGHFFSGGRNQPVHILACERHRGPRPIGMWALHTPVICHQKLCFNWRHLSWGTVQRNHDDMILDGTDPLGERNSRAKLTWDLIAEIRTSYAAGGVTMRTLGLTYGVTEGNIWHIIKLRTWRP